MQRSRKVCFTATLLFLHVGARGATIQIGTVLESTNSAVNFTLSTSTTTFAFNITETITDLVTGTPLITGPFTVFPGVSVQTNVGHSNPDIWGIAGQFSVQNFTLSDGSIVRIPPHSLSQGFWQPLANHSRFRSEFQSPPSPSQTNRYWSRRVSYYFWLHGYIESERKFTLGCTSIFVKRTLYFDLSEAVRPQRSEGNRVLQLSLWSERIIPT
jgi:hypothetical protein